MSSQLAERHSRYTLSCWALVLVLLPVLLLVGCGQAEEGTPSTPTVRPFGEISVPLPTLPPEPEPPAVDLTLVEEEVLIEPQPLGAGFPFTVTAFIHNNMPTPAGEVPVMILISARQEEVGYSPYTHLITVTVPASQSLQVDVPVRWNLAGGEHEVWIQVNRLPDAWQERAPTWTEVDTRDNVALIDLVVEPFDAYTSDLCSGRVDVEIEAEDVAVEPDGRRVWVRVRNVGNRAVYNLPVAVTSATASGVAYTPAIPPCGGKAEVYVAVDQPFKQGDTLTVEVNPPGWVGGLQEDIAGNNRVSMIANLTPAAEPASETSLDDYDFTISTADIEIPEPWHVLVTVHNLGTRDAANVPILVENEEGRWLTDSIPFVQGEGLGVAAIRVGYLWIPGGTLTFTVNPEDGRGALPEPIRDNNTATFTLP